MDGVTEDFVLAEEFRSKQIPRLTLGMTWYVSLTRFEGLAPSQPPFDPSTGSGQVRPPDAVYYADLHLAYSGLTVVLIPDFRTSELSALRRCLTIEQQACHKEGETMEEQYRQRGSSILSVIGCALIAAR